MERRTERRFAVSRNVELRVLEKRPDRLRTDSIHALILNLSGNGMRLQSQFPVACGASVEVIDNDTIITGTVCSCMPHENAYSIGVRIVQYIRPIGGGQTGLRYPKPL